MEALVPNKVYGNQNVTERKKMLLSFFDQELNSGFIEYYSHCINKLTHNGESYEEFTENEIKLFVLLRNSSIFAPVEYNDYYDRFTSTEELKLA